MIFLGILFFGALTVAAVSVPLIFGGLLSGDVVLAVIAGILTAIGFVLLV